MRIKVIALLLCICLSGFMPGYIPNTANAASTEPSPDALRTLSIQEINRYLSQMDPDDVAAALKVFRTMQVLKLRYVEDVSTATLLSGAVKGAVSALGDPYSVYLDPKMYQEIMIETKGTFSGVGIILGVKDKALTVVAPIESTPADKAGVLSGDMILKIDGLDTKDMSLDEAVSKIRGPEGTKVVLTIGRAGQDPKEFPIIRSNIQLKTVSGKVLDNNIGYIRISMFNENTSTDFFKKYEELESEGMRAVILDLRNNPGGLLEECIKVAGAFVPKGPIVSVVTRDGSRETYSSDLAAVKYPLVVLVNNGSASASEIVAGAVQDTDAGTLLGVKTFGKGSVQSMVRLDSTSAVKFTIAKYYTPKNRSIHSIGIEPDVKIAMPEDKENTTDVQLNKAIELLLEKMK